jgi:cytochrome c peroxidase
MLASLMPARNHRSASGGASRRTRWLRRCLVFGGLASLTAATSVIVLDLSVVGRLHSPTFDHLAQGTLLSLVQNGHPDTAFDTAFEHGDELFETVFNALDGVGANVGQGQRFTHVPRADLTGPGEWANHFPPRATGPNARSCNACHNLPSDDGAGDIVGNVHRDPGHTGNIGRFIQRNTPHTFGTGGVQRLAEEMTAQLQGERRSLGAQVQQNGGSASTALTAKGVSFGTLSATNVGGTVVFDTSGVRGVDPDLVVKPFQWKGSVRFIREFNRDAGHNEIGMQADEIVGNSVDGDGDGVTGEFSVGDMTALAVYLAAQPRPTSKVELSALGLIPALTQAQLASIGRGAARFAQVGCADCHRPVLTIDDPIFREPSSNPSFRDATLPGGQNPVAEGVRPDFPVSFDLTQDQPDNQIVVHGHTVHLGSFRRVDGFITVELFGDLKRHDMGPGLAESIDEVGTGASTFLTENLWGVGSTAPYMHDGRATTLTEAILEHGGEGAASRAAFLALATSAQADLIAFLDNLVLFKAPQ